MINSHIFRPRSWPGSQAPIEIRYKILAFGYAYYVQYTVLFLNQGGYYNSLTLQALELLPGHPHPVHSSGVVWVQV